MPYMNDIKFTIVHRMANYKEISLEESHKLLPIFELSPEDKISEIPDGRERPHLLS
jgi:hypothetical protein